MKTVEVIGAGFSGLTLAHELKKLGVPCVVREREKFPGGLLQTLVMPEGLVETAANALLGSDQVDQLFKELNLEFAVKKKSARKRYVYWDKPRRWPISVSATARLIRFLLRRSKVKIRAGETVREFARREIGGEFEERLLAPALQGVYAGETSRLSAKLVLGAWLKGKRKSKGSVAPKNGMGELMRALAQAVQVEYGSVCRFEAPTVICTSAWTAAEILESRDPEAAAILARCESLPLTTATLFFEKRDLKGFGCLFPRAQKFNALGVLFNDDIFEGRARARSETWILNHTGEEIQNLILKDRQRLTGRNDSPLSTHIRHWPRAIPYYTVEWEKELSRLKTKPGIYLHGNYLGALGLAQILERSRELARKIKDEHA